MYKTVNHTKNMTLAGFSQSQVFTSLLTGSVPGSDASKCETSEFGGAMNLT